MVFRKCSIGGVRYGTGTTQVQRNIAMIRGEEIPRDEKMVEDVPNVNFVDNRLLDVLAGKGGEEQREFSFRVFGHGGVGRCTRELPTTPPRGFLCDGMR